MSYSPSSEAVKGIIQSAEARFIEGDWNGRMESLIQLFAQLCRLDAEGNLSESDMAEGQRFWITGVKVLADDSPYHGYQSAVEAVTALKQARPNEPVHLAFLIAAGGALYGTIKAGLSREKSLKRFQSSADVEKGLDHLETILRVLAPYAKLPDVSNTFYSTLTAWENILFEPPVSPGRRYQRVHQLRLWCEAQQVPVDKLGVRMVELEHDAVQGKGGQKLLLNVTEETADAAHSPHVIDIGVAHAKNAGVHPVFTDYYRRTELCLANSLWTESQQSLFDFYLAICFKDDENETSQDNDLTSTIKYWRKAAEILLEQAPEEAFQLAVDCMDEVKNMELCPENMTTILFAFVLDVGEFVSAGANDPKKQKLFKNMFAMIMCHSSEFDMNQAAGSYNKKYQEALFCEAADRYTSLLAFLTPGERWEQVKNLELWMCDREEAPPLLADYIDQMFDRAVDTSFGKAIPFEEDGREAPRGEVLGFKPK